MSEQHTHGPWATSRSKDCLFGAVRGNRFEPIGFVYHPSFSERSEVGRRAMADAQLISTAPELLAMLVKIVNSGSWYYSALEIDTYPPTNGDGEALEKEIRALIAKATTGATP